MGRTSKGARVSQPYWANPSVAAGLNFIPGRDEFNGGEATGALMSIDAFLQIARYEPIRAAMLLANSIPEVSKGVYNGVRMGCGEDACTMQAMEIGKTGDASKEAPEGTHAIKELFENLPQEVGSFRNAMSQNFLMVMFSGMCASECVPAARNKGLKEVWPLDTLSIKFKRNFQTKQVEVWQRYQTYAGGAPMFNGYQQLPPELTYWNTMDGFPDDVKGRGPYNTIIQPAIEIVGYIKDMLLAWHRVGTPKWDIGFDYEMHARVAKDILGIAAREDIEKYVEDQFNAAITEFESLQADDAFFHDIQSKISVNGSGGQWPNVEQLWQILQWRLIMGMKEMPAIMGVGGTSSGETWAGVDWQIYAKGLERMAEIAAYPLVKAAQLHLRLLGMPYKVVAKYAPIRANQRMVDAQAEQIEIDNSKQKVFLGYKTQDEASIDVTGSAAVAPMDKEALGAVKPQVAAPGGAAKQGDNGGAGKAGTKGPSK